MIVVTAWSNCRCPAPSQGEHMLMFTALPVVKARGQWSYSLPNPANISFSFYYFLCFFMLLYIPREPLS